MKKSTFLAILAFCLVGIAGSAIAQKTIARSDLEKVGEFTYSSQDLDKASFETLDYAKAGDGITWDFSTVEPMGAVYRGKTKAAAAAGTPYASDFPDANFARFVPGDTSENYNYTKLSDTEYVGLGSKSKTKTNKFTDTYKIFALPFKLNDTFDDTYTLESTTMGNTTTTNAKTTTTYDGYGKLITPKQTFNNVIRIKRVTEMQITPDIKSILINYSWVTGGMRAVLMDIFVSKVEGPLPTQTVSGSFDPDASPTSMDENITEMSFQCSPNPVNDILTVRYEQAFQSAKLQVNNTIGQKVWQQTFENASGIEQSISNLPTGIYTLTLNVDGKVMNQKIVVE